MTLLIIFIVSAILAIANIRDTLMMRKKIINAMAVLNNICTLCNELEDCYFNRMDSGKENPHTPKELYNISMK